MAYDLDTLQTSFDNAKYDKAYYSIFFVEAEKFFRTEIPISSFSVSLYRKAEEFFNDTYDFDDLIQDCLLRLWELIDDLKLEFADGINIYLIKLARFKLHDFVNKQIRRRKIATFTEIDKANESTYFDNFDEEELTEAAEQYKTYSPGEKQQGETVIQADKKTYKKIAEFSSVSEAARETGIERTNISKALSGKAKSAGGFLWVKSSNPLIGLLK